MKKQLLLSIFIFTGFATSTFAGNNQSEPGSFSSTSSTGILKQKKDEGNRQKQVLSDKFNDSIYYNNWVPGSSSWALFQKEYLTRDISGLPSSRLYLRLATPANTWRNYWLDEMEYFTGTTSNKMTRYQLWDTISSQWVVYNYQHYSVTGHPDESWYKMGYHPVSGRFDYGYRSIYQFDGNGNKTGETDQFLDTIAGLWVDNVKYTFIYSGTLLTEQVNQYWDTVSHGWVNTSKSDYTYDASDFLTEITDYGWQTFTSSWSLSGHVLQTNNAIGNPLTYVYEYYNGSGWDTSYMNQYAYQSDSLLTSMLGTYYNSGTHTWINRNLLTNVYGTGGQQQTYLFQVWNPYTSSWTNVSGRLYDPQGNITDNYYLNLDYSTYAIQSGNRYLSEYDAAGRFSHERDLIWDSLSGSWKNSSQFTDTYEDPVNYYYIEELGEIWDGSNWVNDYQYLFYWSYPSGIGERNNGERLCFYENPMQAGTSVECPSLHPSGNYSFELISMNGTIADRGSISAGTPFVIGLTVASGTYMLRIRSNGKPIWSDKVVILNR
ncbi:MAG: hypothetical protein NTU98_04925 [Bacteroidetes bacterium]|nr:hypothetical protein [Bacteroidota bacterium]